MVIGSKYELLTSTTMTKCELCLSAGPIHDCRSRLSHHGPAPHRQPRLDFSHRRWRYQSLIQFSSLSILLQEQFTLDDQQTFYVFILTFCYLLTLQTYSILSSYSLLSNEKVDILLYIYLYNLENLHLTQDPSMNTTYVYH